MNSTIHSDNIHILDKQMTDDISFCLTAEKEMEELKSKQDDLLEQLKRKSIEINQLREKKIEQINTDLEQANIVLDDLINKKEKILEEFCRKNGHSFSPINYKYNNFHSKNKTNNRQTTYKCKNCGITSTSCCINNRSSQKNVSFNEISLQLFNINFYELTKEITNINNYIKYLIYLKEKICEYFGHDVTEKMLILPFSPNLTIYECKCCGKTMNFDEYQNSQFKAICRGTTPESAVNLNHWHMFGSETSKISLPSFCSYKKVKKKL